MMKFRFKNILGFLLLCLFLFTPILFRAIDRNFEIFPSITLPSNANLVQLDRKANIAEHQLYGLNQQGNRIKLNHNQFFMDIPIHFSHWIIRNNFGLDKNKSFHKVTPRLGINYIKSQKVTETEVKETKKWIREQLRTQGLRDSILIVSKHQIFINHDALNHIDKTIANDTIFELYR